MKKIYKYLIFIVLVSILTIILTRKSAFEEGFLSGEKVTDGLYVYNLDIEDVYHSTKIIKGDIYYLLDLANKYELYKINIYNNKKEIVGVIELPSSYCYLEKEYIVCTSEDKQIVYDYNLKVLYNGEFAKIIPYKNNIIKVIDNDIYYDNEKYKEIDNSLKDYDMYDYEIFDDNIYLYFGNSDGDNCIYNINEGICESYEYYGVNRYSDDLYYFDNDKIYITNLNNKDLKEYNNPVNGYLLSTQLKENLLYYFANDYFRIYDLENNKVGFFDYRINKYMDDMFLSNNLLYLITSDEVFIIKLDEITTNEMTIDELETEFENKLKSRIDKIMDEYNVDVKIREEANLKFDIWNQSMVGEDIYDVINDTLDDTEDVLKMFGKDFFEEFVHDEYTGIGIYLVSQISTDSFSISGEAFRYYDKYAIVAQTYDYKRTLCHELMHTLEDAVFVKNNEIFDKWDSYNPKDFNYMQDYNAYDLPYKYTPDYEGEDVYFVDNYAEMNELEDRARIFENICMNTTSVITENPNLLKKAQYQIEEILKYYPMLEDSFIHDNLNYK